MKFLWFGLGYFVHHFVCVSSILDTIDINIFHDINILGQLSSHAQLIQSNERQLTTIPKLSPKTGLSESCSNKLCLMFESALTCPIMPLSGLNEVCAQYFLGAFLHCPIFPNNLFDAPYTCITEFAGIITKIQGPDPAATLSALFKGFVYGNFTTNCKENCYQQYITRANDFYGNCGTGIQSAPLKTSYPIASILNNFDQFRNQSCGMFYFCFYFDYIYTVLLIV